MIMNFIINLITGIPPLVELIAAGVMVLVGAYNIAFRTYLTYILTNPETGQVYIGRASGLGEVSKILQRRLYNHKYYAYGFTEIELDRAMQGMTGYRAIRGREQQLIDYYSYWLDIGYFKSEPYEKATKWKAIGRNEFPMRLDGDNN